MIRSKGLCYPKFKSLGLLNNIESYRISKNSRVRNRFSAFEHICGTYTKCTSTNTSIRMKVHTSLEIDKPKKTLEFEVVRIHRFIIITNRTLIHTANSEMLRHFMRLQEHHCNTYFDSTIPVDSER